MTDTLAVHVNRGGTHAVSVEPSFETADSFAVVVHNHGSPTHVHLRMDGDLATVASLRATNHFVETDSPKRIPVTVETDRRPVEGDLEILTGFGAESAAVAIDLVEPERATDSVVVDEQLGRPGGGVPSEPPPEPVVPAWVTGHGPVLVLAVVAVVVAFAAVLASDALSVVVGLVVVLVGLVAAGVFLRRPE